MNRARLHLEFARIECRILTDAAFDKLMRLYGREWEGKNLRDPIGHIQTLNRIRRKDAQQ